MDILQETSPVVFDPATLAQALDALSKAAATGTPWVPGDESQTKYLLQDSFLEWFYANRRAVDRLQGFKVMTATWADPLNQFLKDHGFEPMFREIGPGGVGACAILDMLVNWVVTATRTHMDVWGKGSVCETFDAFEVPLAGVEIFDLPNQQQLVKLGTSGGGGLWLVMNDRPVHDSDLLMTAVHAMEAYRRSDTTWIKSVIVPTIEIDAEADLGWMLGINSGDHFIDQAFQMVKIRINEEGARVKAASGLSTTRGMSPQPLKFNRPFTGWFTQGDSNVPICAFYADKGCWKTPAGSLDEL